MEEMKTTPYHRGSNIQEYVRMLVKRRWAVVIVFLVVFGTAALRTFTEVPIYTATVQILIERQVPRLLDQGSVPYEMYSEEFYQTQYKLLESKALAKKLVDKLKLKNHPNYRDIFKSLPPDASESQKQLAEDAVVSAIAGGVTVTPIRQSSLVNLSFSNPDPKFAAYIANALAQCFIEQSLDLRFAASQEAAVWLKGKVAEARKKLEESEAKLNQYKRAQNIVTMEDKENITSQKLEQLNKELVAAQTRRMEVETRFNEVSAGRPIAQVLDNGLIQNLKAQEVKLVSEQSELSRRYGPDHPRMIQLNNELSTIRGKMSAEMQQVVQTIKNEYRMAKAQEENLKEALNAVKADTQDLGDRAIQYRVLLRDVETNRALYENVLKSMKTVTTTENLPASNIRIVYPASVPQTPVSPRTSHNLFIGAVLGLGLGVFLAFGLESLDTTLKTPEDVAKWLEIPNLSVIPHIAFTRENPDKESSKLYVHHGAEPLAAESCRSLRTSILFSAPGKSPQTLLLTSSLPAEGKTITAVNLATVMAKAEPKVLLVDADLRRPNLHQLLDVPKEPGLSNFLVGEIDELPVVESFIPNLSVISAGKIPPNPSELLGSERMQEFLVRCSEQFNRIILDSPPIISVTDAAILSTHVAGVLLVIKAEHVPRRAAIDARNQLLELKAPLLGSVFNDMPMQRGAYYFNYYAYRIRSYHYSRDAESSRRLPGREKGGSLLGHLNWVKARFQHLRRMFS
jgi:succinoglycan biosynthesis transport protein ExoP